MHLLICAILAISGLLMLVAQPYAQSRTKNSSDTTYTVCGSGCNYTSVGLAFDDMARNIDGGGYVGFIDVVGAGVYDKPGHYIRPLVGFSSIFVRGDPGNKSAVTLKSTTSNFLFQLQEQTVANINFQFMTIDTTGKFWGAFGAYQNNTLALHSIKWVGSSVNQDTRALQATKANAIMTGNHELHSLGTPGAAGGPRFADVGDNGLLLIEPGTVIDVIGNPALVAFLHIYSNGTVRTIGATVNNGGNATGLRYAFNGKGFLDMGGLTGQLPGNTEWNDGGGTVKLANGTYAPNGISGTKTVSKPGGSCTITFLYGVVTGSTC